MKKLNFIALCLVACLLLSACVSEDLAAANNRIDELTAELDNAEKALASANEALAAANAELDEANAALDIYRNHAFLGELSSKVNSLCSAVEEIVVTLENIATSNVQPHEELIIINQFRLALEANKNSFPERGNEVLKVEEWLYDVVFLKSYTLYEASEAGGIEALKKKAEGFKTTLESLKNQLSQATPDELYDIQQEIYTLESDISNTFDNASYDSGSVLSVEEMDAELKEYLHRIPMEEFEEFLLLLLICDWREFNLELELEYSPDFLLQVSELISYLPNYSFKRNDMHCDHASLVNQFTEWARPIVVRLLAENQKEVRQNLANSEISSILQLVLSDRNTSTKILRKIAKKLSSLSAESFGDCSWCTSTVYDEYLALEAKRDEMEYLIRIHPNCTADVLAILNG